MIKNKYRDCYAGSLREKDIDKEVVVAGFIENIRDHGGVIFVDLRDFYGTLQLVSNDDKMFDDLTRESSVTVKGIVRKRDEDDYNDEDTYDDQEYESDYDNNENETEEIVYTGEMESNIKQQKISNQGGIIAFRYAINNLSNYISNENEEVDYGKLLQLTNIKEENIKTTISFDFIITLTTNRKYQTNIQIDIPAKEVIEKGVAGIELTEFNNLIFKRIEN